MHTVPLGRKLRRPIWWDLGVQLPRRLSEKVSQEVVTSEPNNSSQDDHCAANYHGDGNEGRGE